MVIWTGPRFRQGLTCKQKHPCSPALGIVWRTREMLEYLQRETEEEGVNKIPRSMV